MRRFLCTAALAVAPLLVSACATTGAPRRNEGPQGQVVGVVKLPQGVSAASACNQLQVVASNANGQRLGDSSIHAGRDRCSYTVDYVEANVPVTLSVAGGDGLCSQGKLQAQGLQNPVQVQEMQTKLVDFALTCAQ